MTKTEIKVKIKNVIDQYDYKIEVISPDKTIYISCKDSTTKLYWVEEKIKSIIKQHPTNIAMEEIYAMVYELDFYDQLKIA